MLEEFWYPNVGSAWSGAHSTGADPDAMSVAVLVSGHDLFSGIRRPREEVL
jgi:hypothetical protein